MNILTPDGKVYAKVYVDGEMLCISPSTYDYKYTMNLDSKVIPQLIEILRELKHV